MKNKNGKNESFWAFQKLNGAKTDGFRPIGLPLRSSKNSLKSHLSDTIKQKDDERDHIAYVMERVAKLWGEKLDDQSLAIHGKRVAQVFKDLTSSSLVTTRPFMQA